MHNLKIDFGSCVRVYSKFSNCDKCATVCPHDAITYEENIPVVSDACTDCGGCLGGCPTEAISLSNFDMLEFLFGFIESDETLISCKKNIPCLSALSVEHLVSLAILKPETTLDLGHCEQCPITEPLFSHIQENIAVANRFLETLIPSGKIKSAHIAYEAPGEKEEASDRRAFLQRFTLKGAVKSKAEFEKTVETLEKREVSATDSANIRKKTLPNKRKLLFMTLKRLNRPETFQTFVPDDLSFISNKEVDDACDNCSMCYRICPTGALQTDKRATRILFDPLNCVKCALCHDVCEPNAIKLAPFSTEEIFNPKVHELKHFKVIRCDECANYFSYFGGERLCPRCKIEEEEAKRLWGIQ